MPPLWAALYISFNFNMVQKLRQKFPNFQASFSCQDILPPFPNFLSVFAFFCLFCISFANHFSSFFSSFRLGRRPSAPIEAPLGRAARVARPVRAAAVRRGGPRHGPGFGFSCAARPGAEGRGQ